MVIWWSFGSKHCDFFVNARGTEPPCPDLGFQETPNIIIGPIAACGPISGVINYFRYRFLIVILIGR